AKVVEGDIPDGWIGVDVGPKAIATYQAEIAGAGTVVWNGPLGKFEDEAYSKGTRAIAEAMAASKAITIVGGGETAEAVEEFGLDAKMKHVSTGGGGFLRYREGTPLAGLGKIEAKSKKKGRTMNAAKEITRRQLLGCSAALGAAAAVGLSPRLLHAEEGKAVTKGRIKQSVVFWCFNIAGDKW